MAIDALACCHMSNTCDSCWMGEKNWSRYSRNAIRMPTVIVPCDDERRPCAEHDGRADVGQQQHEREVDRDQSLRLQPRAEVLAVDAAEAFDVAVLAHVGLRDPNAREALLQVRVDRRDRTRVPCA